MTNLQFLSGRLSMGGDKPGGGVGNYKTIKTLFFLTKCHAIPFQLRGGGEGKGTKRKRTNNSCFVKDMAHKTYF